jgi:hypothetical protein
MIEKFYDDSEELYSSQRDEQPTDPGTVIFNPEPSPEYQITAPVQTSAPAYQPASDIQPRVSLQPDLKTEMTFIPTISQIRIAEMLANENTAPAEPINIDTERLSERFTPDESFRIIDDIEKGEPLDVQTVSTLIETGIVTPKSNQTVKRLSFVDRITNTLYNLIYK